MTQVWFVLGYLGSGKTTFVKNFLAGRGGKNAVLVNDFGAEDVDGALLHSAAVRVESIVDGSVFCSCRSDRFVEAMLRLSEQSFDRILVETSGFSNPFRMRQLFSYINARAANPYRFAGAVCVVDAARVEKVLYTLNAVKMQIAAADVILINKSDLADDTTRRRVERSIREWNADAPVFFTTGARLEREDFPVKERTLPAFLEDITVQKLQVTFEEELSAARLDALAAALAEFCHRIKGIVRAKDGYAVYEYVDGVGRMQASERSGNFLILLAAGKFSLRERAGEILKEAGVKCKVC